MPTADPVVADAAVGLAPPDYRALVDSAWREQASWSALAGVLKQRLGHWRRVAAVAGVLGAVASTAAGQLSASGLASAATLVALAGAGLLAVVPVVLSCFASAAQVGAWTRCRATAEALKSHTYQFLVGLADAAGTTPDAAGFLQRREEACKNVADLALQAAAMPPTDKQRPTRLDIDGYIADRLLAQANGYYDPRARDEAAAAQRLRRLEFGLGVAASALGFLASPLGAAAAVGGDAGAVAAAAAGSTAAAITLPAWLAAAGPWLSPWPAVLTAAGSAVATHLAAARHETQASVYRATAQRLRGLHTLWSLSPGRYSPAEAAALVDGVETAITTENGAWLADWGKAAEAG